MTLTFGQSPFGSARGSYNFGALPAHIAYVEPWPRRMRAVLGDRTVLDSRNGMMLHRTGAMATLLFPLADLAGDVLTAGAEGAWSIEVGTRSAPQAVTRAPKAQGPAYADIKDLVIVDYDAMDRWFEEDDPIYAHPRDPYHRVDVRSSSRHVVIRHADVVVAETRRPKLLFETGLPVRFYLPFADVRIDLLQLSQTISQCPYKGDGQHWNLLTPAAPNRGAAVPDAAWSLPHPLPEAVLALEHVSFYPDIVQVIVDGHQVVT